MTKLELIDLVREMLPVKPHRKTVEMLASVVFSDYVKAVAMKNPSALSQYRKNYTANVVNNVATIPVPIVSFKGNVIINDYVPVGEEEAQYLQVIDTGEIDTVKSYIVRGQQIEFLTEIEQTEIPISVVPSLDAYADTDQIEFTTEQLGMVMNFIKPHPEKQINDRNENNL